MAGLRNFLRCIGEAVCANGLKALAGAVPFGAVVYEVAENACQRLREAQQDDQLALIALADPRLVREEAASVAADLTRGQSVEIRQRLTLYLAQVPAATRHSAGRLVRPEDLLVFLPSHLPRFQPGDRPSGVGDWELVELLGMGGFGEVWKARHIHFDGIAPVAFKFCLEATAREQLLHHEARVLNQVMRQGRHPGIVPLLDACLNSDPPCLKYEFIEGNDLASLIRSWPAGEQPRWQQAAGLVLELARIVAFAHRLTPPVVHRDLKPANVLIPRASDSTATFSRESNRGIMGHLNLKVTDFGIGGIAARQALAQAGNDSTSRHLLGTALRGAHTPLYASPQQVRGEAPDPRDDVHALGVIWYQLLTGDLLNGAPTGLWTEDLEEQGMPRELIRCLGASVAARSEKRPADAGVLADQLAAFLSTSSSMPAPATVALEERLTRFLNAGQTGGLPSMLDLTNRRIGDVGAIALAASPRLANLSVLILSGCDIGNEGIRALAASPHVLNLTRLDLWDNRVGDEGVAALASCESLENLTHLDLSRNRVGDRGIQALAASRHFRHLSELLLVSNHISDEGALALASSPHLSNLAWLKPLDNRISARGADALKATFGKRVRIM